jgi:shikimate dehydrogenase
MIPILGVAGRPVLHSMSPVIFRELFRASGTEAAYTRVAATGAAEALGLFRSLGMRGMNLTAPFKEEAARLVDELTPAARDLGAVNCLLALEGGRVLGANTDPQGVSGALEAHGVAIEGRRCLVIGAGGAGKSAARALVAAGGAVVVANRTRARAEELASALGCEAAGLDELAALAAGASVIVSTLASDALPDPDSWLPRDSDAAILDADYKRGALARLAAARGQVVATGAEWLVHQALPAYELFMGRMPSVDSPLGELLSAASPVSAKGRKIALVGLMGAGKTAAGRVLARLLGVPFVDADREIETDARMSVGEIFASEGESNFRARELRMIDRITSYSGASVLSTGGGAPTVAEGARLLKERCIIVWLHVSPERAAERTRGPGAAVRPLLSGGGSARGDGTGIGARLARLEAERRGAYASCAELTLSTEGRDARLVAEMIHDEIDRVS